MSNRPNQNRTGGGGGGKKNKQNNSNPKSYNRTQSQPDAPKASMTDSQKVFNYNEAREWMSAMWSEWSKKSGAETYQCNNTSVKPRLKPSDSVMKELGTVAGC